MDVYSTAEYTDSSSVTMRVFSKKEKVLDFLEYKGFVIDRESIINSLFKTGKAEIKQNQLTFVILKLEIDQIRTYQHNKGLTNLLGSCGKLVQVITKMSEFPEMEIHPDGTNLKENLEKGIADIEAALIFVKEKLNLRDQFIQEKRTIKIDQLNDDDIGLALLAFGFEQLKSFEIIPPKHEKLFLYNSLIKEMVPCTFDGDAYYNSNEYQFIEDLSPYKGWTKMIKQNI